MPDAGECSPASQPPVAFCGVRRCEGISLSISPNCTDAVASLVLFGLGGVLSYSAAFPDLSEQSIQAIHLPRQCIRLMEKALVSFFFNKELLSLIGTECSFFFVLIKNINKKGTRIFFYNDFSKKKTISASCYHKNHCVCAGDTKGGNF